MKSNRRVANGLIDREKPIGFRFNDRELSGFEGDTLASALLANGVSLVGRSFKYHRPRGIFSHNSDEPNALVELHRGAAQEPNIKATTAELFDGLEAMPQNFLGSLNFDLMAVNNLLHPFIGAGFYYKTFMRPAHLWKKLYEPFIRRAAGLGKLSMLPDPDCYDSGYLHCDLLIVGAGSAGLSAALTAGRSGLRVILADDDFLLGGGLNFESHEIDGESGAVWAKRIVAELKTMPNVRIMTRTTVFGSFDHGIFGACERKTDHLAPHLPPHSPSSHPATAQHDNPRQISWRIYSKHCLLAAGSGERSIVFANNDRPGIMLAGSVRAYLNRFGVAAGAKVAIFCNNDDGLRTIHDLEQLGVNVCAVIDPRDKVSDHAAKFPHIDFYRNCHVTDTYGWSRIEAIELSNGKVIETDCLAVSGGWNPNIHLGCHHNNKPEWNEALACFTLKHSDKSHITPIGAAAGIFSIAAGIAQASRTATHIAEQLGGACAELEAVSASDAPYDIKPLWQVHDLKKRGWLDLQHDVTSKDMQLAQREGFAAVEHVKRYTTLGMATDQGKAANLLGIAVMAELTGQTIAETGTTVFRPPYDPISIGVLGGRSRGIHYRPYRLTPSHGWATDHNASFTTSGMWLRAEFFPLAHENHWQQSVDREVTQTRTSVGICDVSSLGKIDIKGGDALEFVNRLYSNAFGKLGVGKVRYGLMLRDEGLAYDDGTCARLGENHLIMTTTTANAALVFQNMEFARQCLWPHLDVNIISVTDACAQFAIAGPNSRALLERIVDGAHDISNESFPFMACREISVCGGQPARLYRISFSGELAYEISVPWRYGAQMMKILLQAGDEFGACPYGLEALNVMRIEKGHPIGSEITGQASADMMGMTKMRSLKKDYIGATLAQRPDLINEDQRLVGLVPCDWAQSLNSGAHFLDLNAAPTLANDLGWMTSCAYSPTLKHYIGLGYVKNGANRHGDIIRAYDPLRSKDTKVRITSPHFVDPSGDKLRA